MYECRCCAHTQRATVQSCVWQTSRWLMLTPGSRNILQLLINLSDLSPPRSLSLSPAAELHRLKYRSRDVLKENVHLIKSDMLEKVCLICRFVMVCGKLMTVSCCLLSSPQTHCLGSSLQGKPPHLSSVHNLLRTKHQTDVIRD